MNRKTGNLYFFWAVAILICLLLVLFALLFASCSKHGETAATAAPTETPAAQETAAPATQLPGTPSPDAAQTPAEAQATASPSADYELGETQDAGQEYVDKLTFLGDSTTYGLKAYGVLKDGTDTKQVWTPASGTLTLSNQSIATIVYPETGEEITIAEAVKRAQPEYLVITLGVNGVSFMNEESFTKEYTDLVQTVQKQSPNTKIILNSIYPVASNYDKLESINNEKISAANQWIRAIAQATGTRFCNSAPTITGSDGFMDPDCGNGDGLHLSSAGFLKILQYMRTHAYL